MNKLKVKQPPSNTLITYDRVCIRCGMKDTYTMPVGIAPRPRPNTTPFINQGNRLSCLLGSHQFYFTDEVEENK